MFLSFHPCPCNRTLKILSSRGRVCFSMPWMEVNHVTCVGQWALANATQTDRKGTCPLGFDLVLHLEHWDHHGKEPALTCWGMRGHEEENWGNQEWPAPLRTCQLTTDTSKSSATEPGSVQNCPQNREKLQSIGVVCYSAKAHRYTHIIRMDQPLNYLDGLFESHFCCRVENRW